VVNRNYLPGPNQANIIYQQLGADYADRIIAPTIQESVKASVAKSNAEELITKRATAKAVAGDYNTVHQSIISYRLVSEFYWEL
jgi:hypothetical protein